MIDPRSPDKKGGWRGHSRRRASPSGRYTVRRCGGNGIVVDGGSLHGILACDVHSMDRGERLGFGGLQIHGGKDNVVDNSPFFECMAAITSWPWGDARWRQFAADAMAMSDIERAFYTARYPELGRLAEDHDVNCASRNLVINCREFLRRDRGSNVAVDNATLAVEEPSGNHSLLPLMTEHRLDPILFDEIGLYESPWRPHRRITA